MSNEHIIKFRQQEATSCIVGLDIQLSSSGSEEAIESPLNDEIGGLPSECVFESY
jgi:hypothetical protein